MNILIPMSGSGSRFTEAGYKDPKPLIDINGKTMIERVIESLNIDGRYIFVIQKSHNEKYDLEAHLKKIVSNSRVVQIDHLTEGAASTCLKAKFLCSNKDKLVIVNSDQYVEWDSASFVRELSEPGTDGLIATFKDNDPKWSFARVDKFGFIAEVAEKHAISDDATVGIYGWQEGWKFVKSAEKMIRYNLRVNNEFYVCPVYNVAINEGAQAKTFPVKKMYGLGTPEDLKKFLEQKVC